jgi:hypothetical protein
VGIGCPTANVTDRDGVLLALGNARENLSEVKKILAEGGYPVDKFSGVVKEPIGATVEIVKRN